MNWASRVWSLVKSDKMRPQEDIEWPAFLERYQLPKSWKRPAWSMDTYDFEAIFGVARSYRTDDSLSIAELGSGLSTLVFVGFLCQIFDELQIVSIEGERTYARQVQRVLAKHRMEQHAFVSYIPYVQLDNGKWFDKRILKQVLGERKFDILIVDAPPGISGPRARHPAIPFFLPYLTRNSNVLLHDADRPDELRIAKEWRCHFRGYYQIKTPRGIAVFSVPSENCSQGQTAETSPGRF